MKNAANPVYNCVLGTCYQHIVNTSALIFTFIFSNTFSLSRFPFFVILKIKQKKFYNFTYFREWDDTETWRAQWVGFSQCFFFYWKLNVTHACVFLLFFFSGFSVHQSSHCFSLILCRSTSSNNIFFLVLLSFSLSHTVCVAYGRSFSCFQSYANDSTIINCKILYFFNC